MDDDRKKQIPKGKKKCCQPSKSEKKKINLQKVKKEQNLAAVKKDVIKAVKIIKTEKKQQEKLIEKARADYSFKINDRVRLIDGNVIGTIEKLEKGIATINYGKFKTKAATAKLEFVEKLKTK